MTLEQCPLCCKRVARFARELSGSQHVILKQDARLEALSSKALLPLPKFILGQAQLEKEALKIDLLPPTSVKFNNQSLWP